MEIVSCNHCGSKERRPILAGSDFRYGTPGAFTVVRCRSCGLAYVSPRPGTSEIGQYYPSTVDEHRASSAPNDFAIAQSRIVALRQPQPGRILDIGCAAGYFLAAMGARGWEVSGVEPSAGAARKAADVARAQVKCGMLEAGDHEPNTFDAVTLWQVLEHLHDPQQTLRIVHSLLRPPGFLYLGLPNFGGLERRLFGKYWFGLDLPRHLYHFDPASIEALLKKTGFKILSLSQASGHDIFRRSVQTMLRKSGENRGQSAPSGPASEGSAETRSRKLRRLFNKILVDSFTRFADKLGLGNQMLVVAAPVK